MTRTVSYPQAPALTDDELREFLLEGEVARLATVNEDGSVHLAPLWYRYEEPEILLGTQVVSRKVRNIQRNPQVTVLFDVTQPSIGAVVYGTARLDRHDAVATRASIFSRYMDDDAASGLAAELASLYEPVIIRVTPERVVTFDYRKGFPPA